MTKLKDLKDRFMKDPEFRKEYARADESMPCATCAPSCATPRCYTEAASARLMAGLERVAG